MSSIKKGGQSSFSKSRRRSCQAQLPKPPGYSQANSGTQEIVDTSEVRVLKDPACTQNQTSSRTQSWLQSNRHWPVSIIQEQVPLGVARPQVKFPWVCAQELMQAHLPCKLAHVAYDLAPCAHLAAVLSAEIRDLVKDVTSPHYRLVCSISIGGFQWVPVGPTCRQLCTSHCVNPMLFCMALGHTIYLE